jgi:hypothetical protein
MSRVDCRKSMSQLEEAAAARTSSVASSAGVWKTTNARVA